MARVFVGASNQAIYNSNGVSGIDTNAHTISVQFQITPTFLPDGTNHSVAQMDIEITAGNFAIALDFAGVGSKWLPDIFASFTTLAGSWRASSFPGFKPGVWYNYVVSYIGSGTGTKPIVAIDGVSYPMTTITTPIGTHVTGIDSIIIGNNAGLGSITSASVREVSFWGTNLTEAQCILLSKGRHPYSVGVMPNVYLPLKNSDIELRQNLIMTLEGTPTFRHYSGATPTIWIPILKFSAPPGMTITGVVPTVLYEGLVNVVISGSGFGATQETRTVYLDDKLQNVVSWSDSTITFNTVSPNLWASSRLLQVRNT